MRYRKLAVLVPAVLATAAVAAACGEKPGESMPAPAANEEAPATVSAPATTPVAGTTPAPATTASPGASEAAPVPGTTAEPGSAGAPGQAPGGSGGSGSSGSGGGGAPTVVKVATNVTVAKNGTVSWVIGKIVATEMEPTVKPVNNTVHKAKLASNAVFLTPNGCSAPYGDVKVDANGAGLTPCTKAAYLTVDEHYGPMIWLGANGTITKIADRYAP